VIRSPGTFPTGGRAADGWHRELHVIRRLRPLARWRSPAFDSLRVSVRFAPIATG